MKSKLTLILTVLALLALLMLPAQAESTDTVLSGSNWHYENGVLTITGNLPDYNLASSRSDWFIGTPFEVNGIDHTTTEIIIEEGVTSIGDLAFYGFSKLTKVTFPSTLTSIGSDTFMSCTALTEITIPASVTSMGNDAFSNSRLTKIVFEGKPPKLGTWSGYYDGTVSPKAFSGSTATVYYPPYNAWSSGVISNYSASAYLTWQPTYNAKGTAGPDATWTLLMNGDLVISGTGDLNGYTRSTAPWYNYWSSIEGFDVGSGITFNYSSTNPPKIKTSLTSIAMGPGGTMDLAGLFTVDASFIMEDDYTLTIADESVATLSGDVLTAVDYGRTTLTVAAKDHPEIAVIIPVLVAEEATSITLPTRLYAGVGTAIQLTATTTPSSAAQGLIWSVADASLAAIDGDLLTVTATAAGSTTVTASSWNGTTASTTLHIYVPTVSKVTLAEIPAYCGVGDTLQLVATVRDNIRSYENQLVTFSSSDETVATVDANGLVTFLATGPVSFTAQSDNGKTSTVSTNVLNHTEYLEIDPLPELFVGETAQASIFSIVPGSSRDYITWASGDETIATVDENGLVTALSAGNVQINVTSWDGMTSAAELTVHAPITAVSIDMPEGSLYILDEIQLTARVQCEEEFTNRYVTWESSDPAIVSVDENGLAFLAGYGSATITATAINGIKAEITLTIRMEIWEFSLEQNGDLYQGGTCQMKVVNLDPEDADPGITWVSADPAIVAIDQNGLMTGVAEGTTEITATAWNGLSRSLTVIVNPPCEHPDIVTDAAVEPTDYATGLTEGSHCGICGEIIVAQEVIPANFTVEDGVLVAYNGSATDVVIPADLGITEILSMAFSGNKSITSLVIPEGVVTLDDGTFAGCTSLVCVTLPDSLDTIVSSAFSRCTALTTIKLPSNLERIGDNAFQQCSSLTSIALPEGITHIGQMAFYQCEKLADVQLPNTLTTLGDSAFLLCFSLKEITLPNSLTSIGSDVFGTSGVNTIHLSCISAVKDELIAQGHESKLVTTHDEQPLPAVDATCVSDGLTEGSACADCGEVYTAQEVIPATGHTPVTDEAVAPTDYATGLTEGSHCDVCGEIIVAQEVIPANFTVEDGVLVAYNGDKTDVVIPADLGVTRIGDRPFQADGVLTSIVIPEGVTTIGQRAFYNCTSLASVSFPQSLTHIESSAFGCCTLLSDITLPSQLVSIGNEAFMLCDSMDHITLPDSLTHLGDGVFFACAVLNRVTIPEGITTLSYELFSDCANLTEVILPSTLTTIGSHAFYDCESLASLTIPEGVTSIGDSAFYGCSLSNISIPNSVTSIGDSLFEDCSVETISVGCVSAITDELIAQGHESQLVITHDVQPLPAVDATCVADGLTEGSACADCGEVYTAQEMIPATGHTPVIDEAVDATCTTDGLTEGSHCETCGEILAAQEVIPATGHTPVTIEGLDATCTTDGLTEGSYCEVCGEILVAQEVVPAGHDEVTIPQVDPTCTLTGLTAKIYCDRCGEVLQDYQVIPVLPHTEVVDHGYPATDTTDGLTDGSHCSMCGQTLVPQEVIPARFTVENGVLTGARVDGPELVIPVTLRITKIGDRVFRYNDILTSIVIPEGVTEIGDYAFDSCSALETVQLPSTLTTIGAEAFHDCTALTNIQLPSALRNIGHHAFASCVSLPSVVIPEGVTEIGAQAFDNCASLAELQLPSTLQSISYLAFGYTALTEITIPDSVTTIAGDAFEYCRALKAVHLPDALVSIGDYAFRGCSSLEQIELPDSLTSLGKDVFYYCSALQKVKLSNGLTNIPEYAFYYCSKLTDVVLPSNLASISNHVFALCDALTEITIPDSVTSIDATAFGYNSNLTIFSSYDAYARTWAKENGVAWKHDVHTVVTDAAVEVTCTTDGLTEGSHCEVCGEILVEQEIVYTTGHQVVIDEAVEPTDRIPGLTEGSHCEICGEIFVAQEEILPTYTIAGDVLARYNGDAAIVIVPDDLGVTTIGAYAFNDSDVTEVVLPEGITAIEEGAFSCNYQLEYVHLPSTLRTIGEGAFNDCRELKSITIPEGVTELPRLAFYSCYALAEVKLPGTLTTIGEMAFDHCEALQSIVIPDGVTDIDGSAFEYTHPELTIISSYDAYARTWANDYGYNWQHDVHTVVTDAAVEVTCTTDGLTEGSHCEVCGEIIVAQEIVYTTGHTPLIDVEIPPACEETGLTEGSHCDVCGEVFVEQEVVNAIGHDWQNGKILVEPTCTSTGLRELICANDPTHISDRVILALPHTEVEDPGKDATCLAPGLTEGSHCDVCGAVLSEQVEIPIIPHREGTMFVAPTCTEPGEGGTYCLDCGTFTEGPTEIPPLGHGYNITNTVDPTCTEEGFRTYVCNEWNGHEYGCGDTYTDVIPALGHTVVIDAAVPPTCTADGLSEGSHCEVCGEILIAQQVVSATGHTEVIDAAVEVTCTTDGLTEGKHCDVCGEVLVAQEIIPAGHNEVINVITDPTCTEDGMAARACDRCYEVFEYIPIPAGHIEVTVPQVDPTCTLIGLTEKVYCSRCGEVFKDHEVIPAIPHTEVVDYGYPATDTTDGLTDGSHCSMCGQTLVPQEVIPARFTVENGVLVGCRVDGPELVIPITLRITKIGNNVFRECTTLTSVVIPEGVTTIGEYAFVDCTALENVTLPSTLTTIDAYAFHHCIALTEVVIPEGVTKIGANAFHACYDLEKITLPSTVESIGEAAFFICESLTEITLPEGITEIGAHTFSCCRALTEIIIPEGVTTLGTEAFSYSALEKLTLPSTLTTIGRQAFAGCNIAKVTLPASVTSVGENAFDSSTHIVCDMATQGKMVAEACAESSGYYYFLSDHAYPDFQVMVDLTKDPVQMYLYDYIGSETKVALPAEVGGYPINRTMLIVGWYKYGEVYIPDSYTYLDYADNPNMVVVSSWDAYARTWANENGLAWRHAVHTEEIIPAVEATQDENGLTEGKKCAQCGEIIVAQEIIPAGKHKVVIKAGVAPTCTTDGLSEGSYCSKCGEVFKMQTVIPSAADAHVWHNGLMTSAPSGDAAGQMTYTCRLCGATKTVDIHSTIPGDTDCNGLVDVLDVIDMMEWYCGGAVELNLYNADVNDDGQMDMLDIVTVMAYACGWDVELK